jgi:DNA-binding SARP family transcriptional activator
MVRETRDTGPVVGPVSQSYAATPSPFRLRLMRGFALTCDGDAVAVPQTAQRVLAFVALHDRPLLRLHIAASLWLDVPERRTMANLRSALWRMRQAGVAVVDGHGDYISLQRDVVVDVREFATMSRFMLDGTATPAGFNDVISAGELLPDWYDDWVLIERERLRQLRLHALERASLDLAADQRYGDAVDAVLAAISEEPLRESSHRLLITMHLAEGNRLEAIRQFKRYAKLMRVELGLEPAPEIAALLASMHPRRSRRIERGA